MLAKVKNDTRAESSFDYATALRLRNQKYKTVEEHYLQVGTIKKTEGWILHLSAINSQISALIQAVLPILIRDKIAFKLISNARTADLLLNGKLGAFQIGKIFRIYPETDTIAHALSRKLIEATAEIKGPAVPTDAHLGGALYARYGSFNPVLMPDAAGQLQRYIHDSSGNLIPDLYNVPFALPLGRSWPFSNGLVPKPSPLPVLNNTYLITSELKTDVKGRVLKTIQVKGLTIRRAVVKEARHHIGTDNFGRDIIDRLRWQFELQNKLRNKVSIPKVYDFFSEAGNQYLAMELIKGKALDKIILETIDGMIWKDVKSQDKITLINYLSQVIENIKALHALGYVHRDITPVNFILDRNKKIILIDLEGTYSLTEGLPTPPFDIGTLGFMPPEHDSIRPANTPEDIYSLGALMFVFATGLKPAKFLPGNSERIENTLSTVWIDDTLYDVIRQCTRLNPLERPGIKDLSIQIHEYCSAIKSNTLTYNKQRNATPTKDLVKKTIIDTLHAFAGKNMLSEEGLWHSIDLKEDHLLSARDATKTYTPGLYEGVGSAIYVASIAKRLNYPINALKSPLSTAFRFINSSSMSKLPNIHPGFYHGTAGQAMAMTLAIRNQLLPESPSLRESLTTCLSLPTSDLTMAQGIAGQCMAMLQCYPERSQNSVIEKRLSTLIDNILSKQQRNGSWQTTQEHPTGISYGVSGITMALIGYHSTRTNSEVKQAIRKAISWLETKTIKKEGTTLWITGGSKRKIDPWFGNGVLGIILTYMHAYDILEDPILKKRVHDSLTYLSHHLTQNDFSLANGLCGIGEIYLEAARIFKTQEYQPYIDRVLNLVLCARHENASGTHWIANNERIPYVGLGNGNGGILHFLMRYENPDNIKFPLFGIK
ncbi:lanthionine synthetase LanC family protein [Dawidia soli]|uniref:Protein kinase n=1 Tax=Dawidia soli TaxID=2782352 RepID=A0AAP2DCH0_9BACT|nr:lanthionine synthetase LanC family protein [Dawidia soli]MBT1689233.1 protein kinase [Dawidia soli]